MKDSTEVCAVALTAGEVERSELPSVCVCCGAPATVTKTKAFLRAQPILSVPSRGIVGLVSVLVQLGQTAAAPRYILNAPFCAVHADHWALHRRTTIARLAMAFLAIGGFLVLAACGALLGSSPALCLAVPWLVSLYAAAACLASIQTRHIRQMEPHPDFLFLCHVSSAFRNALIRQRQERDPPPPNMRAEDSLESMCRRHNRWLTIGAFTLPLMATLGLSFVGCAFAIIAPPSVPQPAGGPRTKDNDLHCYQLLRDRTVSRGVSWIGADEGVGTWNHQTTIKAVDDLNKMGAARVYFHPSVMVVVLPRDASARKSILEWEHRFVRKGEGEPIPDEKQAYMLVAPPN